jgi:glyoxylate/hydroxypyruvate reductase
MRGDTILQRETEILVMATIPDDDLGRIAAVAPGLRVVDARGWYDVEIGETWPQWTAHRYLGVRPPVSKAQKDRDRALAGAEVILAGFPFPLDIRARAPHLRWLHQLPAGASNLLRGDLWQSDITITTSRGYGNTRAMAEYVLACFLHFARGLHWAYRDRQQHRLDHRIYRPVAIEGKTACVVGAGGIGREVGSLCAAAGMRVIGTRRRVNSALALPAGFSEVGNAVCLHDYLAQSDFVAVCCQWTRDTTKLIGREAFASMKTGAVLVNVARGEIVDEEALVEALRRDKLRGVALDVYVGEFEGEPDSRLWADDRVIITPHVSASSDLNQHRGLELFCRNLRAYLDGQPLENEINWERGY